MNDKFLDTVADYILSHNSGKEEKLNVVVPNIRAGLYLRKALAERIDKVSWAPRIISIQDFFHKQSGLQTEEQIPLVFELFKSFQRVAPDLFDSFDGFYPWGEVILSDFNDIDSNLAETKQVFTNVSDLKSIELLFADLETEILDIIRKFWSQLEEGDSNYAKERFLAVWKHLLPVYTDFKMTLKKKGLGYEGMIYRHVAENLDNQLFPEAQEMHYFIGFNVLSQSEQFVFRFFKNQHNALFFWQYDEKLLKHPHHEAFRFIRKYIQDFQMPVDFNYHCQSQPKKISVYAVPSKTAQVKLAANLLKEKFIPNDPKLEHSAVILPDESLLQPVLFSVPPEIEHLNVSMGFPISYAPQTSIVRILSKIQENHRKGSFYHKDVLRFVNHPLIRAIDTETCNEIKKDIIENNWLRIPESELHRGHAIFKQVFTKVEDLMNTGFYFSTNLRCIYENLSEFDDMDFDREIIYQIYRRINRFNEYLIRDKIQFQSVKTYLHLQNSMLNSVSVAFSGEPMKGLQVLGMLETRLLDFNQMMILSMNEGHFPSQSFKKSFIPYNLRKSFNLPTIELQDAIHAYYFYRMIMQPGDLHLLYNTADEGFMKGEKSRYIQQLLVESDFVIEEIPVHIRVEADKKIQRSVSKDKHALELLSNYLDDKGKSFSPSQLNTYIHCSMSFYFKYILGVREENEMVDQVGAMELGNVLHNTLNLLYRPHLNKSLTESDIQSIIDDKQGVDNCILESWKEQMKKGGDEEILGINALGLEATRIYVNRILKLDKQAAPITHLGGEIELEKQFALNVNGQSVSAKLKGSIDHLDYSNGAIRVVDYKTGKGKRSDMKDMETAFSINRKSDQDHVFQVLFYSWLFKKQKDFEAYQEYPVKPLVLYTRENKISEVKIDKQLVSDFCDVESEWNLEMKDLLEEIFNPDIPFTMTSETSHCKYCPFNEICN